MSIVTGDLRINNKLTLEENLFELIKVENTEFEQSDASKWTFTDFKPNVNPRIDRDFQFTLRGVREFNTGGEWTFYYNLYDLSKTDLSKGVAYQHYKTDVYFYDYGENNDLKPNNRSAMGNWLLNNASDERRTRAIRDALGIHRPRIVSRTSEMITAYDGTQRRLFHLVFEPAEGFQNLYKGQLNLSILSTLSN